MHNAILSLEDLYKMKKEADVNNDKETREFVNEEIENFLELLKETEDTAIDILIPKDKYDDVPTVDIEIRPG